MVFVLFTGINYPPFLPIPLVLMNQNILLTLLQDTTITPNSILFWYKFTKEGKIIQIFVQMKNSYLRGEKKFRILNLEF